MGILTAIHALAAVVWVGGMFFAYMALRPAVVESLDPPLRPVLWQAALRRFFRWVWLSVAALLLTGYAGVFQLGGWSVVDWPIHVMHGLGSLMVLIFVWIFFLPYRRLTEAVTAGNAEDGAPQIPRIRRLVATNLLIGLIVVAVATGGRYW
jgi:uncharacterized membrane protein